MGNNNVLKNTPLKYYINIDIKLLNEFIFATLWE